MHYRANEEIALLNDLVGLLVVFGPSEEGEEENDPQLQDLRSELEEKALHVNKLVSAIHVITCMYYVYIIFRTLSGPN